MLEFIDIATKSTMMKTKEKEQPETPAMPLDELAKRMLAMPPAPKKKPAEAGKKGQIKVCGLLTAPLASRVQM
jgi:hypothetical protein